MDPDPPRPARPLDQQGGRLPAARRGLHDRARALPDARRRSAPTSAGRRQALGEMVYEIAQTQIAEQGLPHKAIGRWFPYVASLMLFIWVDQHARLHPAAALGREVRRSAAIELPTLAIYAATSTLSVTLALALMTFVFTHVEGIRHNGPVKYFKSWIPDVPKALLPADRAARDPRPVHAPDQLSRPSLREHARRPHADPHVHRPDLRARATSRSPSSRSRSRRLFYLFEVVIVVSIQAFIFAALSAIYIGSAIEPEH